MHNLQREGWFLHCLSKFIGNVLAPAMMPPRNLPGTADKPEHTGFLCAILHQGWSTVLCMMKCEGHRPKMFLWMLEEFSYILGWLCEDDRDGCMVLGHELLLLTCSRCCSKRGGARGLCQSSMLSVDLLPACSLDTLECSIHASKDTTSLKGLVWAVYNNLLVPRKSLALASKAIAKWYNAWWTMHTEDHIAIVWCASQPYSAWG